MITEAQREALHVAAVFVNNFSNHLFAMAYDICQQEGLDFNILKPLIRQTIQKIEEGTPATVQTGPAARGDTGTIARHLAWLAQKEPYYKTIYQAMTNSILDSKKNKGGE